VAAQALLPTIDNSISANAANLGASGHDLVQGDVRHTFATGGGCRRARQTERLRQGTHPGSNEFSKRQLANALFFIGGLPVRRPTQTAPRSVSPTSRRGVQPRPDLLRRRL